MISWAYFFYFFTLGTILLLSVLGLWFTVILPGIDPLSRRFFRGFFVVLFLRGLFRSRGCHPELLSRAECGDPVHAGSGMPAGCAAGAHGVYFSGSL
ncbi:MAG: hypothetical protein IJ719_20925 [Clostridia bacterium]|nr:hypothetical protein [Clostridia bacterium]